jgi:hypothetical protein
LHYLKVSCEINIEHVLRTSRLIGLITNLVIYLRVIKPRALGVGYDVIDQLLTGRTGLSLIVRILVVFAREVMTTDPVVLTADATIGDLVPAPRRRSIRPRCADPDEDRSGRTAAAVTYPAGLVIVAIARSGSQWPRIEVIRPSSLIV